MNVSSHLRFFHIISSNDIKRLHPAKGNSDLLSPTKSILLPWTKIYVHFSNNVGYLGGKPCIPVKQILRWFSQQNARVPWSKKKILPKQWSFGPPSETPEPAKKCLSVTLIFSIPHKPPRPLQVVRVDSVAVPRIHGMCYSRVFR